MGICMVRIMIRLAYFSLMFRERECIARRIDPLPQCYSCAFAEIWLSSYAFMCITSAAHSFWYKLFRGDYMIPLL